MLLSKSECLILKVNKYVIISIIPLESEYSVKSNYIHHIAYIVNGIYCIKTKILILLNTATNKVTNNTINITNKG